MSTTTTNLTKGAALLAALGTVRDEQPDPHAGHRLLDVSCAQLNSILTERHSDRSLRAVADTRCLHNPDEDSHLMWIGCGIALTESTRPELGFTPEEKNMAAHLASKVRALLAKQFRGEKKPESRKIYEALQNIG